MPKKDGHFVKPNFHGERNNMSIIPFADSIEEIRVIPTGLFIDKLSGIGGIPRGAITEIFGDEGIGKTSACLQLVANAQKQGLRCLWADVEYSFIPGYAKILGVDNSKLGLIREEFAEATLEKLEEAVKSGEWDLIVLDSVGGILPRAEAEKGVDGKTIGGQAGLMARFCRKIVPALSINGAALIVINHSFIDIMSGKLLTSGGRKLAYHKSLSIRFKLKQGVTLKTGDRKVGKVIVGEVRKNKLAATEGLELDGQLIFGTGFSAGADLLNDALDKGVVAKKGNTYYLGTEKLGIGLSRVRKMVEDDAVLAEKIKFALQ
jgi:recombination protein RecA